MVLDSVVCRLGLLFPLVICTLSFENLSVYALSTTDDDSTLPECCRPRIAKEAEAFVINFLGDRQDPGCQAATAIFRQAEDELTSSPVLFVTFDLSNPRVAKQSEYLAKAMGMESIWNSFSKATGFLIVADGRTKQYRLKITRFDTAQTVKEEVRKIFRSTSMAAATPATVR